MCKHCKARQGHDRKLKRPVSCHIYSTENNMVFKRVPWFLQGLRLIEKMMISMVTTYMDVHCLKHGMLSMKGHAVSVPNDMHLCKKLPRLGAEIHIILMRRRNCKTNKVSHYFARRKAVQDALEGLVRGWPHGGLLEPQEGCSELHKGRYYSDTPSPPYENGAVLDAEKLKQVPVDGEVDNLQVIYVDANDATDPAKHGESEKQAKERRKSTIDSVILRQGRRVEEEEVNLGPAPHQTTLDDEDGGECIDTMDRSGIVTSKELHRSHKELRELIEELVKESVPDAASIGIASFDKSSKRQDILRELDTPHFFTMYAPEVFVGGSCDITATSLRTVNNLSDWIEHIYWCKDGRVAAHPHLCFMLNSLKNRSQALAQGSFGVRNQTDLTKDELLAQLENNDESFFRNVSAFGANITGTSSYWKKEHQKLSSLVAYKAIGERPYSDIKQLPVVFHTGSCAENHWSQLHKSCALYLASTGQAAEVEKFMQDPIFRRHKMLQMGHVVCAKFTSRTKRWFATVLKAIYGQVDDHFLVFEFAKLRGMIHFHSMLYVHGLHDQVSNILNAADLGEDDEDARKDVANELALVAEEVGLSAMHPAGGVEDSKDGDRVWLPKIAGWLKPEGCANLPNVHPATRTFTEVAEASAGSHLPQGAYQDDEEAMVNLMALHTCSKGYCIVKNNCKQHFGKLREDGTTGGKESHGDRCFNARLVSTSVKTRLELKRDHPRMLQHNRWKTQGWRANTDSQLITCLNPSEILALEDYLCQYQCKGAVTTDEMSSVFKKVVTAAEDSTNAKQLAQRMIMRLVGMRDVCAAEVHFMLSGGCFTRCSRKFKHVSLAKDFLVLRKPTKSNDAVVNESALNKFLNSEEREGGGDDLMSAFEYFSQDGSVPVFTGVPRWCVFPPTEDFARGVLMAFSTKFWLQDDDLRHDDDTFASAYLEFVVSDQCPPYLLGQHLGAKAKHERKERKKAGKQGKPLPEHMQRLLDFNWEGLARHGDPMDSTHQCDGEDPDASNLAGLVSADVVVRSKDNEEDDERDYEAMITAAQAKLQTDWSSTYQPLTSLDHAGWLKEQIDAYKSKQEPQPEALDEDQLQQQEASLREEWANGRIPAPFPGLTDPALRVAEARRLLDLPRVSILGSNFRQRIVIALVILQHKDAPPSALRMTVLGPGGVGKSHCIHSITRIHRRLGQKTSSHRNFAFAGSAASLIGGCTIHSYAMPPWRAKHDSSWQDIKHSNRHVGFLKENCKEMLGFCLDEASMCDDALFGCLDYSFRVGRDEDTSSFGGVQVGVVLGDIAQLPPPGKAMILGSSVKLAKAKASKLSTSGRACFLPFLSNVMVLTEVMRNDPSQFALRERNLRIREGRITKADWEEINRHAKCNMSRESKAGKFEDNPDKHVYITAEKKKARIKNCEALLEVISNGTPVAVVHATGTGPCHKSSGTNGDMAQLLTKVYLAVGERAIVTKNIAVDWNLTNGSVGTIIDIVYKPGVEPPAQPLYVVVDFPRYTGPIWDQQHPTRVPVAPNEGMCSTHRSCARTNMPLNVMAALNIHKCQGMTFGPGCPIETYTLDIGPKNMEVLNKGTSYVGFGRAKDDSCWAMDAPINWDRLEAINNHHEMAHQQAQDKDFHRSADKLIVEHAELASDEVFVGLVAWLDGQAGDGLHDAVCQPMVGDKMRHVALGETVVVTGVVNCTSGKTAYRVAMEGGDEVVTGLGALSPCLRHFDWQKERREAKARLERQPNQPPPRKVAKPARAKPAPRKVAKQARVQPAPRAAERLFQGMNWYVGHSNRCHIDSAIVLVNAALDSIRSQVCHLLERNAHQHGCTNSQALRDLLANSSKRTLGAQRLEVLADRLWTGLHAKYPQSVEAPGHFGDVSMVISTMLDLVGIPSMRHYSSSTIKVCSVGCEGFLDYGNGIACPRQSRDTVVCNHSIIYPTSDEIQYLEQFPNDLLSCITACLEVVEQTNAIPCRECSQLPTDTTTVEELSHVITVNFQIRPELRLLEQDNEW